MPKNFDTTQSTRSAIDAKRKPSTISEEFMGYFSTSDQFSMKALAAFMPAHPRAFWNQAKRHMIASGEYGSQLFSAAGSDERTLRLACSFLRKHPATPYDFKRENCEDRLVASIMELPGKSDFWRSERLRTFLPSLSKSNASRVHALIGSAARHGALEATEILAQSFPDARLGKEQQDRLRYGTCGYCGHGMSEPADRAWSEAKLHADLVGAKDRKAPKAFCMPTNAFFWIVARARALRDSDPAASARWGAVGAELVARGLPVEDDALVLGMALSSPTVLAALKLRRPALGSPSFYCFHRGQTLFEALSRTTNNRDIAEICSYDGTSEESRTELEVSVERRASKIVKSVPAAGFALLVGHEPHPSWMALGAERDFLIPKGLIAASRLGKITGGACENIAHEGGTRFTLASLAHTLGKGPTLTSKIKTQTVPKPK